MTAALRPMSVGELLDRCFFLYRKHFLLIIPGIILSLMWALTIPVAVLEDKGLRDSVSRSAELTKGNRGRVFVIYTLFLVLTYTVMALWEIPILILIGVFTRGHNPSEF